MLAGAVSLVQGATTGGHPALRTGTALTILACGAAGGEAILAGVAATRTLLVIFGLTACGPASPGAGTVDASSGASTGTTSTGTSSTSTGTTNTGTTPTSEDPTSTSSTSGAQSTSTSSTSATQSTGETDVGGSTGDPAACLMATGTGSEGGTDETTGGPLDCPPLTGQPCTAPIDCAGQFCGSHQSMLDEHGCPRASCSSDADCGPDEGCELIDNARPVTCVEQQGACSCSLGQQLVGRVCLPEALLAENLPAHCAALTNQAACDVFDVPSWGACHWEPTQLHCDGQCAPGATSGACIAFHYVGDGCLSCGRDPNKRAYRRPRAGGTEVFFNKSCGDEPHGWKLCEDPNDPVCKCFCAAE